MLGINLSGAEFGKNDTYGFDYIYPAAKDLSFYAQQGITLVRLPVKWERLQPDLGGELDKAELSRLVKFLDNAEKACVKVIIDVHNYGRYDGKAIGTSAVPIEKFADFWAKMSSAVGSKPAVQGYDLMNEPHGMPNKLAWPQAAQAATDAIRALGDTNTIFVEGEQWANAANWAANNPNLDIHDPLDNLVYEAHLYLDKNGSGTYAGSYDQEGATADLGVRRLKGFATWLEERGAKGFIGEFGVPSDDPRWQVALDNLLGAMNDYGISGTYWGAGPWFNGYNVGLIDKLGKPKASLDTLLARLDDSLDVGLAQLWSDKPVLSDMGGAARGALMGDAGANVLTGGVGNDILDGGKGADTMTGGAGNDTYYVDNVADKAIERVGEGHDLVRASVDWTLANSFEDLTLDTGAIRGTGNSLANRIIGNAAANILSGDGGNDTLDGGAGADRMAGGKGNDTYYVDNVGDTVSENANEGTDIVVATVDWTLSGNVENLTLTGAALRGTGNSSDNELVANDLGNFLYGLKGDDLLEGGAGRDWLDGGEGEDRLDGGAGDDILIGGGGRDWLTGGAGRDTFRLTSRNDAKMSAMDRILDFTHGQDVIDLSAVDANTKTSGNQAMSFIGSADFSRKAGQLRYEQGDGYTLVEVDVNGDGKGDIGLRLEGYTYKMDASDFIL